MNNPPKITILYVDDEEPNLIIFKHSFKNKYPVITASSGEEGLIKLEQHNSDIIVVISDMRMPLMNGVEFIRKAREKYDKKAYFILTGYDYNDEIDKAIKQKVIYKYFTKPFKLEEIEQSILTALQDMKLAG